MMMNVVVNRITGERFRVQTPVEVAEDYLRENPPQQLEAVFDDDVTWFRFNCVSQVSSMIGYTESLCEAVWEGPGWYRTELVLEYSENWLRLVRDNPGQSMLAVRHTADAALNALRLMEP